MDSIQLEAFIAEIQDEIKSLKNKLLRKNKTKNTKKLNDYCAQLVNSYNKFADFNKKYFGDLNEESKKKLKSAFIRIRDDSLVLFASLNLNISLPLESTERINISETTEYPISTDLDPETVEMDEGDMTRPQFMKLCSSTIHNNFNGQSVNLRAFIDSINLLKEFATNDSLQKILIQFIISKLDASPREKIATAYTSIDTLIDDLQAQIKPDNSDIIEGRLLAIKTKTLEEFSEKAEKLAEALQKALIIEGVSRPKAEAMVIEKTVQLCRSHTHAPEVKAVLAAKTFASPKEVIAKMITQINDVKKDKVAEFYRKNANKKNFGAKPPNTDKAKQWNQKQDNRDSNFKQKSNDKQSTDNSGQQKTFKKKTFYRTPGPSAQVFTVQGNEFGPGPSPAGDQYQYNAQQQHQQRPSTSQNRQNAQ